MAFDEYRDETNGVRPAYADVARWIDATGLATLDSRREEAEAIFRRTGITFAVYGEGGDPERLIPFDLIPRVFSASEWRRLAAGIRQRARALNAFIHDVYHRAEIVRAGRVPSDLVFRNAAFLPQMIGFDPPGGVYSHIVGIDIVRTGEQDFAVLEDNCRTPSGVSYMLENRAIMQRMFPQLFTGGAVRGVETYPQMLRETLAEVAPPQAKGEIMAVVLTPGPFNSAYYEHSFLADLMGIELVEPADLFVDADGVWMKTTGGPQRVHVIYRRIDDDYLDPIAFRPDSFLGIPGLFHAYRAGQVTIVSAPGAGIADDKAIYCFVPEMIRFYLGEEPLLPNVPTWRCAIPEEREHVLANLDQLVAKEVHGSGGYGMIIGPQASDAELAAYAERIRNDPDNFIAQPTLDLSTSPTLQEGGQLVGRHVDFRPFCLVGKEIRLVPGGLTRVALAEGSLVVNSSQGGGVKDSWVLEG